MNENQETLKKNNSYSIDPSKSFALIHKPSGLTSFDCIRKLKKHWNTKNLGHGGTLDKFAEGLLPIFINEGLKFSRFFLESYPSLSTYWKTYQAVMEFGNHSDTGDPEGNITQSSNIPTITELDLINLEKAFTNKTYLQQAPIFSAKKVNGKRMSDLARELSKSNNLAEEIIPKSANVTIQSLKVINWASPFLSFEVKCSKGTYIRSLAVDIAKYFNSSGFLVKLNRIQIGNFSLQNAIKLEDALSRNPNQTTLPIDTLIDDFPKVCCSNEEKIEIQNGRLQNFLLKVRSLNLPNNAYVVVCNHTLIALIQVRENTVDFLRGFSEI